MKLEKIKDDLEEALQECKAAIQARELKVQGKKLKYMSHDAYIKGCLHLIATICHNVAEKIEGE